MNLSHHGGSCGHSCCLRVENMSVKIGTDCILKDVNLHVHCGEMAAIIGPNGCGTAGVRGRHRLFRAGTAKQKAPHRLRSPKSRF